MTRPYTEEQVFDLELCTEQMAHLLSRSGHGAWMLMDEDTLEAILYDGMIALREAMLEEADTHGTL
jgi:hypothetical protein